MHSNFSQEDEMLMLQHAMPWITADISLARSAPYLFMGPDYEVVRPVPKQEYTTSNVQDCSFVTLDLTANTQRLRGIDVCDSTEPVQHRELFTATPHALTSRYNASA